MNQVSEFTYSHIVLMNKWLNEPLFLENFISRDDKEFIRACRSYVQAHIHPHPYYSEQEKRRLNYIRKQWVEYIEKRKNE